MNYRDLTQNEIDVLISQHCVADDWKNIRVHEEFQPDFVQHVHFSGTIRIGVLQDVFTLPGGIKVHSAL